jgi:regulator of replication initiation timing
MKTGGYIRIVTEEEVDRLFEENKKLREENAKIKAENERLKERHRTFPRPSGR